MPDARSLANDILLKDIKETIDKRMKLFDSFPKELRETLSKSNYDYSIEMLQQFSYFYNTFGLGHMLVALNDVNEIVSQQIKGDYDDLRK